MKKTALMMILASMLLSAEVGIHLVELGKANPFDLPIDSGISIYSRNYVPYQDEQYENSNVMLNIKVILVYGQRDQSWADSVHLNSICYTLDGQPLDYIYDFAVENHSNYGRDKQHFFTYTASVRLEDLSEASHTVTAYANDTYNEHAYINSRSASYNFTVDSQYQAPLTAGSITEAGPLPASPVLVASVGIAVVGASVGLLVYHKKRQSNLAARNSAAVCEKARQCLILSISL